MNNRNFILTTDKKSADYLLSYGLTLIHNDGNTWTFLNENKLLFSNLSNITYTNKLNF